MNKVVKFHALYFCSEEQAEKALNLIQKQDWVLWSDWFDNVTWEKHEAALQIETKEELTESQLKFLDSLGDDRDERELNEDMEEKE